jgi:hypothetical protein
VPDVSSYVHLATGMLRSVAFLHNRQLVHRDIKASALSTTVRQSLLSIIMLSRLEYHQTVTAVVLCHAASKLLPGH